MPKKKKPVTVKSTDGKKIGDPDGGILKVPVSEVLKDKQRMCIRAIRITPEILEAAKAYKKDKGVSFYRLGLEAISERLVKEGYLKETAKPKD
jgi:hypothetical protein